MSVSGMFTQGYMDDPFTATLIVNPTRDLAAIVALDAHLTVVAGLGLGFTAVVSGDALVAAIVAQDTQLAAVIQGDGELQVTVARYADIVADVSCKE